MCELLLSGLIVGAVEISPGWMMVERLNLSDNEITAVAVPQKFYNHCFTAEFSTDAN
jgi:hypothetical protein